MPQLVGCTSNLHEARVPSPALLRTGVTSHACHPSTEQVKAKASEVERYSQLLREFESALSSRRPGLEKRKDRKKEGERKGVGGKEKGGGEEAS